MPLYKTSWWRSESYRIVDGKIGPALGAAIESYDPWEEFYQVEGKYRTVDTPWGKFVETVRTVNELTRDGVRPDLGDDVILQWTQSYGLLGLLSGRAMRIEIPLRRSRSSGKEFFEKLHYAQSAGTWHSFGRMGTWTSLEDKERNDLLNSPPPQVLWGRDSKPESTFAAAPRYFPDTLRPRELPIPLSDGFWGVYQEPRNEWLEIASAFAGFIISVSQYSRKKFAGQKPSRHEEMQARSALEALDWHASLETDHHLFGPFVMERRRSAPSLLSVLANMFLLDLENGRRLISCATCRRYFVSNDERAKYCRVACRNLAQTRRYRLTKMNKGGG